MPIRKTITVTLTTHGELDLPCTAACPDLALSTDGPTVAAALAALAKAMEYLPHGDEHAPVAVPPSSQSSEVPTTGRVRAGDAGTHVAPILSVTRRRRADDRADRLTRAS